MKHIVFSLVLSASAVLAQAQQDAQVSLYMRNPLQFNAAHAGLDGCMRVTAISRMQWTGWDGAPRTQFFSAHAPAGRGALGLGISMMNDASGSRSQRELKSHVAVHLAELGNGTQVSAGLSLGLESAGYDFQGLEMTDPDDPAAVQPFNAVHAAVGFGAMIHQEAWYVSVSSPQLLQPEWGDEDPIGRALRHLYLSTGYAKALNSFSDVRASLLLKRVSGAPMSFDVNVEWSFFDVLSLGAMGRFNEGLGMQMSYLFQKELRIHYAVDFPTNGLMSRSFGSHEIGLAWDLGQNQTAQKSPRHF